MNANMLNKEQMVAVYVPVLTLKKFGELVGLEPGVLSAQVDRGYWPTLKVGKRVFVNVELVRQRALEQS